MSTVALIGTFDTKGEEFLYIKQQFEQRNIKVLSIHTGVYNPLFEPDIPNDVVCAAAGCDITEIAAAHDRARATQVLSAGCEQLCHQLFEQGKFDGIFSMGGSGGTSISCAGMRALPIGVPKIMISTMACGDTSPYVGASDICLFPSIVDIAGINTFSRTIFNNAISAMVGMLHGLTHTSPDKNSKPLIAATMFGVTTPCITKAKERLEQAGYEVLVFHATGTGGKCMEELIKGGFIQGVLDLTTTEWCDEVVGGVLAAGPHRMEAAACCGIPAIVSVGACDMVNFGTKDSVPDHFQERNLYQHNPSVTLMRTSVEESDAIGKKLAEKMNMSTSPCICLLPKHGVSMIDAPGEAFYGPDEDNALFNAIKNNVDTDKVQLIEMDAHINDDAFANFAADKLIALLQEQEQ